MDETEAKQADIAAALRRSAIAKTGTVRRVAPTQALQIAGAVLLGAALLLDEPVVAGAVGLSGALALATALWISPVGQAPGLDWHVDDRTGLALASALPITVRDEQAMASLTGRTGVLVLDAAGAAARFHRGEARVGQAVMAAVVHRLREYAWAHPLGEPFGPLLFLESPSTVIIVQRDLLGDQNNRWRAQRMLDELSAPVPWAGELIDPELSLGGATGPASDGPAIVALAALARRDARAGDAGAVSIRQLELRPRPVAREASLVALGNGASVGALFASVDIGSRVGIIEHLANLRATLSRAVAESSPVSPRPFIAASVTALSHPAAAADLMQRVGDAGLAGRVGIVLPSDFPAVQEHRAVATVVQLRQAGFVVMLDRRNAAKPLMSLPGVPIDLVMVNPDLADLGTCSLAEQAVLVSVVERRSGLVSPGISMPGGTVHNELERLTQGGRLDHPAKAGVPNGR